MRDALNILASGGSEVVYIFAVIVLVVISAAADKFKKMMADNERRPGAPPKPVRRPMPPLPRPQIPQVPESKLPPARPTVPPLPNTPFPRPPVRPVARRPVPQPRPVSQPPPQPATPRPVAERSLELPKTTIRGERGAASQVHRSVQAEAIRGVPVPQKAVEPPSARQPLMHLRSLRPTEAAVRPTVAARSFRELSVADLQRAMVLKEILEPPLALRNI